ncbi:MAG TPA: polysaccharide biosynthesis/export family protein [Pirellulales bacterium]|nr:polysaccharide biosynthesis/export family protein [Pirellulales bacterium]
MLALVACACAGCRSVVDRPGPRLIGAQTPPQYGDAVPTEKDKTTLPSYIIEPPDILFIEAIRVVPKPPYHIQATDVLMIQLAGGFPEGPAGSGTAGDQFLVSPDGSVNLGPLYGKVKVVGLTEDQAKIAIETYLREILANPQVSVQLSQSAGQQPITGEHLVAPDGTVNLGSYGQAYVAGLTLEEAKTAIDAQLAKSLDNPDVSVSVFAYNSKVYYVVTEGAGLGDTLARFPITGNETVLDALAQVNGISRVSSKRIWIARPMPGGSGCDTILPVDWSEITKGAATATNFQVLPGDRIFIAENKLIAIDSTLNKMIAPWERIFGVTLLGAQAVQTINRFPLGFQAGQNF